MTPRSDWKFFPSWGSPSNAEDRVQEKQPPQTVPAALDSPAGRVVVRYVDETVVVVDKPAGLPSQPGGDGPALDEIVRAAYPDAALVHRLDQPASGLVLFPRGRHARGITDALRRHQIERRYAAVLVGAAADDALRWTWPVDGQQAATRVQVVGRGSGLVAAVVTLETGRTHQIRQHAARAGLPLAGDRRYGAEAGRWCARLALHAFGLRLRHPVTRAELEVRAPLPEGLVGLWGVAGGPSDL